MTCEWMKTLHDWQPIAGAIVGGIFSLCVALIVAGSARSRAERSAGMTAVALLLPLRFAFIRARDACTADIGESEDQRTACMARDVRSFCPPLHDRFDEAGAILSLVNEHLGVHLVHVRGAYTVMTQALAKIDEQPMGLEVTQHQKIVRAALEAVFNYGGCATMLINQLVLSRWRHLHRVRYWLWPDELQKQCRKAIKTGRFEKALPDE